MPAPEPIRHPDALTAKPAEDRILTAPNAITLARLAFLPVFVWLVADDQRVAAAALLSVLSATDFVDGWVARRFHQESRIGKLIDPAADRILFLVGVITILLADAAPVWVGLVVVGREVLVSSITLTLLALGAPAVDVLWVGKAGTFALMTVFPMFLAGSADWALADAFTTMAWIITVPGLVLSFVAVVSYIPSWTEAWRERQVARGNV
jgi:cardiolipin synthase